MVGRNYVILHDWIILDMIDLLFSALMVEAQSRPFSVQPEMMATLCKYLYQVTLASSLSEIMATLCKSISGIKLSCLFGSQLLQNLEIVASLCKYISTRYTT